MPARFPRIILHPGKERSVLNRHPWLFSGAVKKTEGNPEEGDLVEIYSSGGSYLATGHYHRGSIAVRIFSFQQIVPDESFWKEKLQQAYNYRKALNLTDNSSINAYRLIHGEGDGIPGLIIDIYNATAVIQAHTTGIHRIRHELARALQEVYKGKIASVYDKSSDTLGKPPYPPKGESGGVPLTNGFLKGNSAETEITENGIRFYIDVAEGQKTGFFLDQRENRKLLGGYAEGKKVLNTFAYSGGFSLYALKNNAALVHSVDSSKKCAEWAEKNVLLNNINAHHHFYTDDVFDFFRNTKERYDLIVLDPPAFAKRLSAVKQAAVGYRNLNMEAIKNIAKGGILFTFSCSQAVDRELFRKIVFSAAAQARRSVRIMHQLTQPPDHPVSLYHPEGEYLKGLVLYVED